MQDWLPNGEHAPEATTPATEPAPEPQAAPQETAAPQEAPVPQETPAPQEPVAPQDNGCTYHYANPTPQSRPVPPPVYHQQPQNGWQQPQNGWQQPQNGWQQPQNGWQQPPKRQKPRHTGLLVVLSVVCVISLMLSTIMAIKLLRNDGGLNGWGDSATTTTNRNGTTPTTNPNAPDLTIQSGTYEELDGGLSAKEMVRQNLNSTILLHIYEYTSVGDNWGWGGSTQQELEKTSGATGIVWTADGYIITNAHCVYNDQTGELFPRLDVELYNGTVYEDAAVIGYDTSSDLAVIKVDATDLTPAVFGDSSKMSMGDRVVAIGNPGGLGFTSTEGTISGLNRDVYEDTGYGIKCMQTDASINPGNSGGPLINSLGQVIGINSAKIVSTGYEGLGFTIPINEAKPVLDELVKNGKVTGRVSLGIYGTTITTVGLEGFQITEFSEGTAFRGTNAKVGDIIAYVDGVRTPDYSALRSKLATYKVGDRVEITLWRYNSYSRDIDTVEVTVTLQEENR